MRNETQWENGIVFKGIISEVFFSIKRALDMSPFPLVPRGPLGPLIFAHDEVNVHCRPAKKIFFHNSQLHNERLLDRSQNP